MNPAMNPTSPAKTGAAGAVTAAVVTVIAAIVGHFKIDIPADAQVSIAVGIVTAAHWFGQAIAKKAAAKSGQLVDNRQFATASIVAPAVTIPPGPQQ